MLTTGAGQNRDAVQKESMLAIRFSATHHTIAATVYRVRKGLR